MRATESIKPAGIQSSLLRGVKSLTALSGGVLAGGVDVEASSIAAGGVGTLSRPICDVRGLGWRPDRIAYREGYKYQLAAAYSVRLPILGWSVAAEFLSLSREGWLVVKAGYAWDGASGPTWDSAESMRGSLVHDALYQLMRVGALPARYRLKADRIFYVALRRDGMLRCRARRWYCALRRWAGGAIRPSAEKLVYLAP